MNGKECGCFFTKVCQAPEADPIRSQHASVLKHSDTRGRAMTILGFLVIFK